VGPRPELRLNTALARLIASQVCLHASMAGLRMAEPLLALRQGRSAAAVGLLLPLLAARTHEGVVIAAAMVVTAVLFALYPLMPSALAMGLCSVLLGLGLAARRRSRAALKAVGLRPAMDVGATAA